MADKSKPNTIRIYPQKEGAASNAPLLWGYARISLKEVGALIKEGKATLDEDGCLDFRIALWGNENDGKKSWGGFINYDDYVKPAASTDLPDHTVNEAPAGAPDPAAGVTDPLKAAQEGVKQMATADKKDENDLPF